MAKDTRSFFEKLTGVVKITDDENSGEDMPPMSPTNGNGRGGNNAQHLTAQGSNKQSKAQIHNAMNNGGGSAEKEDWIAEEEQEGQLTVDVFQTPNEIIIQTMIAGVKPEDLDISITRDMVTIKGRREATREVAHDDYFFQELYWGAFSRTIELPQEIEVEESEASEKYGLLTLILPKIDRNRQTKLKVRSSN